jgi:hypothetical protein
MQMLLIAVRPRARTRLRHVSHHRIVASRATGLARRALGLAWLGLQVTTIWFNLILDRSAFSPWNGYAAARTPHRTRRHIHAHS